MQTQTFNAVELSSFNELGVKIKTVTGIEIKDQAGTMTANGYTLSWDYNPVTKHLVISILNEPTPGQLGTYLDKLLGKGLDGRDAEER